MNPSVLLEVDHPVARVTLNRPDVHNAFDDTLIAELTRVLDDLSHDRHTMVVQLRAAGKSFCAGADLHWMKRVADYDYEQNLADAERLADMLQLLYALSKPTIALVHGAAFGGGVGLTACCDIALASPGASFSLSEVKLGLIPATISPFVANAIGARATRHLALTGERIDAAEAHRLGLVHELLDDEAQLDERAAAISRALACYGPATLAAVKSLVDAVAYRPIDRALHHETAERIAERRSSAEGREGIRAFLEKRPPRWPH